MQREAKREERWRGTPQQMFDAFRIAGRDVGIGRYSESQLWARLQLEDGVLAEEYRVDTARALLWAYGVVETDENRRSTS